MKRKRLKRFVLPTLYVLLIVASFFTVTAINKLLVTKEEDHTYAKSLLKDTTEQVLNEVTQNAEKKIVKPYTSSKVNVKTTYYSKDDEDVKQQESLILYKNTYMPSTGVLYNAEEEFDVVAAFDGEVKSIKADALLGTVVEISHNTNLTTYYYSLKNVTLKQGDHVVTGDKIGNSSTSEISDKNSFLFEVYYQGKSMNPEKFYEANPNDLQ